MTEDNASPASATRPIRACQPLAPEALIRPAACRHPPSDRAISHALVASSTAIAAAIIPTPARLASSSSSERWKDLIKRITRPSATSGRAAPVRGSTVTTRRPASSRTCAVSTPFGLRVMA